jgi:hypothetical protein
MAINFLNNLNFNSIQVENIVIENFSSDVLAGTGVEGQIYWNTTAHQLRGWDGNAGAWIPIGTQDDTLTFAGDAGGNQTVDLNAQIFTVGGTANEIKTSGTGQTLSVSLADGAYNATPGVGTNLELPDGSAAVTQTAGDNTRKVATTAFVTTAVAASDTLAEVLAIGNTTGGTDIAVSAGDDITFTATSAIVDSGGSAGAAGQYLSSTSTTIDWITPPTLDNYVDWKLTGTSSAQISVVAQADIALSGDGITAVAGGTGQVLTLALTNTDKGSDQDAFKTFTMSGTNSSGSIAATTNEDTGILAGTQNQINIVGGTKTATWSLATGIQVADRLNLLGTPFAPTAASGTDTDQIATTAFVQAALIGLLEFKGGFRADTGQITSGANFVPGAGNETYLWGAARVAVLVGDFYIASGAFSGDFYGDTLYPLTPGDSVIAVADASANASVVGDWAVVQSDTDLATYSTLGLGNVNVENDTSIAAGYHGSSGGAATGGVLNIAYTSGTADIALRESTASALGIVSIVEGSGIDVAYSSGAATISLDHANNPNTSLVQLDSSDAWITRTFANGITRYDIDVNNTNVFDPVALSANVLAEVQVANALAFTGAIVGQTVYAEITRNQSTTKLSVTFSGDSTDAYFKVWLTRMA